MTAPRRSHGMLVEKREKMCDSKRRFADQFAARASGSYLQAKKRRPPLDLSVHGLRRLAPDEQTGPKRDGGYLQFRKMMLRLPPIDELRRLFHYDPDTGVFTWRVRTSIRTAVGDVAGAVDQYGYRILTVNSQRFRAHRIAWALVTGEDPYPLEIDHRNGHPGDDRFSNLRLADRAQQMRNRKRSSRNTSGVCGVAREGKWWRAYIRVAGKAKNLGRFMEKEDAVAARKAAEEQFYGEFARGAE